MTHSVHIKEMNIHLYSDRFGKNNTECLPLPLKHPNLLFGFPFNPFIRRIIITFSLSPL